MYQFERVYIEISNVCNLHCSFCPPVLRPAQLMEPQQFGKILDAVKPYTKDVTLHVMGEPLLHPDFDKFIALLEEKAVPLFFISNGILLAKHVNTLLNSSIIKQINFSVHSFFDNFPQQNIADYLALLTNFSRQFIKLHPKAFINYRIWNLPEADSKLEKNNQRIYAELAKLFECPELPDSVNVKQQKSYRLERHIKLHFDTQFEWPSLNSTSPCHEGFCYGLQKQLAILSNGIVVPCCLDKEAVMNLGQIFESSLESIINSERAQNIIKGFAKNKAVEPLCRKCQYKIRFE